MFTLAALFVATMSVKAQAAVTEIPLKGGEKILISVPQAVVNLQASSGKSLRINLSDSAPEDYQVDTQGNVIRITAKDAGPKDHFGRYVPKKRIIDIQGPSLPVEVHLFDGQILLNKWAKDSLLQVQKGHILSREGSATVQAHCQNGDIQILDHQGNVDVDSYKASVVVRDLNGDADIENFAGETVIDKAKGYLDLSQGQGTTKISGGSGSLQFEVTKGIFNVQGFQGRVEGETQEGPVSINMTTDTEVNVHSQNGRVTVHSPPNSGAFLNLASSDGDIQVPNYLQVRRDGSQKTLKGRLKGEHAKGSIVVRSTEGSIIIR